MIIDIGSRALGRTEELKRDSSVVSGQGRVRVRVSGEAISPVEIDILLDNLLRFRRGVSVAAPNFTLSEMPWPDQHSW